MDLFKGCLLASDIDDTLVSNGKINRRNCEKIKYFISEGGIFSLSTGRSPSAVNLVLREIKNISPSVVANGTVIYDFKNKKPIFEASLSMEEKETVKEVLGKVNTVGVEIHSGDKVFTLNNSREVEDHQNYEELNGIKVDFETVSGYNWNKVIYLFVNDSEEKRVKSVIHSKKRSSDFVNTSAMIDGRKRNYYEQLPKNCSKASGLKKLCEIKEIKKGCLYAIGDYYNDIEMLGIADISAVVKDSPDDVKTFADIVVGSASDGAVADFIDYLTKKRKEECVDMATKNELKKIACRARMGVIEGTHAAKSGHPGGSLSCIDILTYLYFNHMNIDPKNPKKEDRDRLVLSKGHAAPALYSVLALRGYFDIEEMKSLRQIGALLQGHPDMKNIPGVDMSTGSLGQGISAACGMALSSKHFGNNYKVYSILGDGESEEGQVWEAAMFAANKKLSNLTVFVDYNNLQIDGTIEEVNSPAPFDTKFEAFGWHVITIDGHDFDQIENALKEAATVDKPVAIIANTVKGKGVSFMEDQVGWHGVAPNDEQYEQAIKELQDSLDSME